MTVEVFKTNVLCRDHANILIEEIQTSFSGYKATFDLEDCDKILRVQCEHSHMETHSLIEFLLQFGFEVLVLPDIVEGRREDDSNNLFVAL